MATLDTTRRLSLTQSLSCRHQSFSVRLIPVVPRRVQGLLCTLNEDKAARLGANIKINNDERCRRRLNTWINALHGSQRAIKIYRRQR